MKKIVLAGAVLASVAAVATAVESSNTFGVMKITDSETKELVIGVPWVAVGSANNDAINAMNLVLPTANGDQLYWYDKTNKKYYVWTVVKGAWAVDTTTELSDGYETGSDAKTLARGDAVILKRNDPATYPVVYLSGQYTAAPAGRIQIRNPTESDVPMQVYFTLIANPKTTDVDVNQCNFYTSAEGSTKVSTFGNGTLDDYILLSDGSKYGYDETGSNGKHWYKWVSSQKTVKIDNNSTTTTVTTKSYVDVIIPAGEGAWYVRAGRSEIYLEWPAE